MTGPGKAFAVFAVAVILTVLSAGVWGSPIGVDPTVQDTGLGVIGVIGLTIARGAAVLGAALAPLFVVLRVLALPLAMVGLGVYAFRSARRA